MRVQGDAPGAQLAFSAWTQGVAELAWIVDAAELEAALRAAVRYAPHVNEAAEDAQARLQLLAEGRDSATRQRLGVRMRRQAYGQRGVAARLVSDQPHAGQARQWFRSPDVLALLPMDRPQAGRGLGLVWSLPDERADEVMALADADFEQALMEATGGAAGALRLASARAQWPLLLGRAEAVCGPGWALLGDAAHLVHPLAGQGLNLGLADVASLVRVVAERESWRTLDDPRLLRRYAREREAPTRAMGQVTDGLLRLFASQQPVLKVLRNRGMSLVDAMGPLKRALTARALNG
jgi:ubiquinone biosynthesis UbiH/UbiF/VisC/COQ6 family hydroxylase